MDYKIFSKKQGVKVITVGVKIPEHDHQSTFINQISLGGVFMVVRLVRNRPKTTQQELFDYLKVTKKTIGKTSHYNGSTSCAHAVPPEVW